VLLLLLFTLGIVAAVVDAAASRCRITSSRSCLRRSAIRTDRVSAGRESDLDMLPLTEWLLLLLRLLRSPSAKYSSTAVSRRPWYRRAYPTRLDRFHLTTRDVELRDSATVCVSFEALLLVALDPAVPIPTTISNGDGEKYSRSPVRHTIPACSWSGLTRWHE
jgi:hypothetical protein